MNPRSRDIRDIVLLEGELEAKRLMLRFLWKDRRFVLCSNFTFLRYNGTELRHSAAITAATSVAKAGSREFILTFTQPELRYHIRAASSDERDRWVAALQGSIGRASALALEPVVQSRVASASAISSSAPVMASPPPVAPTAMNPPPPPSNPNSPPPPAPPPPVINFATEWLDECNRICPKTVDYATQCPKGHTLVPFADGSGSAPVQQRVMCRICHGFTEREHACQWLVCSVAGCCAGYVVCDTCASALQQAPAAAAASHDFPSLVRAVAQQRSHL